MKCLIRDIDALAGLLVERINMLPESTKPMAVKYMKKLTEKVEGMPNGY